MVPSRTSRTTSSNGDQPCRSRPGGPVGHAVRRTNRAGHNQPDQSDAQPTGPLYHRDFRFIDIIENRRVYATIFECLSHVQRAPRATPTGVEGRANSRRGLRQPPTKAAPTVLTTEGRRDIFQQQIRRPRRPGGKCQTSRARQHCRVIGIPGHTVPPDHRADVGHVRRWDRRGRDTAGRKG